MFLYLYQACVNVLEVYKKEEVFEVWRRFTFNKRHEQVFKRKLDYGMRFL